VEWLILGIVVALTVINVPIGFALSISAIILLIWKGTASLSVVPLNLFSGASSFPLLAIPLFILAGGLMETSGISLRLVNLANSFVGFIRGGLAMVTVVATMIQSEISGSSVADAAAIGNVVIPAMEKRGYPRALSAAIVSNAASAAILIPPSQTGATQGHLPGATTEGNPGQINGGIDVSIANPTVPGGPLGPGDPAIGGPPGSFPCPT